MLGIRNAFRRTLSRSNIGLHRIISFRGESVAAAQDNTGENGGDGGGDGGGDTPRRPHELRRQFASAINSEIVRFMPRSIDSDNNDNKDDNKDDETLVILCGWLGAKEKHMNKYVQLYHSLGVDVCRVATRWFDISSPLLTLEPNANRVAAELAAITPTAYSKVVFHCLSAGDYFYASIIDVANRTDSSANSPAAAIRPHVKALILECMGNYLRTIRRKDALETILNSAVIPEPALSDVRSNLRSEPPYIRLNEANCQFFEQRNAIIRANPWRLPALVLYSESDHLTDPSELREIVSKWQADGIDATESVWPDAPHVGLYRKNPAEYRRVIENFLRKI